MTVNTSETTVPQRTVEYCIEKNDRIKGALAWMSAVLEGSDELSRGEVNREAIRKARKIIDDILPQVEKLGEALDRARRP